jgi:error-prone DNA polymerase
MASSPALFASHPAVEYAELYARSAYSLLDAANLPETLVQRARELGLYALALADRDDLGGAVRFSSAAEAPPFRVIHGASLTLENGSLLPLLVLDRQGWSNLCQLISRARTEKERGLPRTDLATLATYSTGLLALTGPFEGALPHHLTCDDERTATQFLGTLKDIFEENLAVQVWRHHLAWEEKLITSLIELAKANDVPWVPTNDVRYAMPADRRVLDVMTCLKHQVTLDRAGTRLLPNNQWFLKGPTQMQALWAGHDEALRRTVGFAERVTFSLDQLRPTLPSFQLGDDERVLRQKVWEGATKRYGRHFTEKHQRQISHEIDVIIRLDLAGYFLIVTDIVDYARSRDILVQGRGSAANSAACYCLGITAIDPIGMDLLFERFLSEGRTDPPDIDIDIAHMQREEVLQYVYQKFGRRHAAMVCTTITWRGKSAIRDVARVLGFKPEESTRLTQQVGRSEADKAATILQEGGAEAAGLDPKNRRVHMLIDTVRRLDRLPRHRSIHTGGFVLTAEPLDTLVPIEQASMHERTVIQWDKDDLGPVGLVKIDLLGLGALTLIHKTIQMVRDGRGESIHLDRLPMDDAAVYEMLGRADTIGLFQVESRAQMNTLPRLKPSSFYDLVVQIAIIRPGPIQGQMVHPYIRRRRGEEKVQYLHPDLEPVLKRTLGIPLFQEQGMKVAITMAGFTPAQADKLRKVMGFKRATDHLEGITKALWLGMRDRHVEEDVALQIIKQLQGFANYGFPESHSASFALITYATAWLKYHYAPEFTAAILNSQPMGFYSPATLIADAKRHGVEIRPVDLIFSKWDCTLEYDVTPPAVRIGLRAVRGLASAARKKLEGSTLTKPLSSLEEVIFRTDLADQTLVALAQAGAFRTMWPGRRQALWELLARLKERNLPLAFKYGAEAPTFLPLMSHVDEVMADYAHIGMSHESHPMEFYRRALSHKGILSSKDLGHHTPGRRVQVAGAVICRQRPGSAKGVFFMTLEDEFGMINIAVMPPVFERDRTLLATSSALIVEGILERHQGVIGILGSKFKQLDSSEAPLKLSSRDFH